MFVEVRNFKKTLERISTLKKKKHETDSLWNCAGNQKPGVPDRHQRREAACARSQLLGLQSLPSSLPADSPAQNRPLAIIAAQFKEH